MLSVYGEIMKYSFRDNSRFSSENAKEVGKYLQIKFQGRIPNANEVVRVARDRSSPIHKYFEWDDTEAAKKWRMHQARMLIASLYVEIESGENVKAYESVFVGDIKSYVATDIIRNTPELSSQVIEIAKREIIFWKLRYQTYRSYFQEVFNAIEGVQDGKIKARSRTKYQNPTNSKESR